MEITEDMYILTKQLVKLGPPQLREHIAAMRAARRIDPVWFDRALLFMMMEMEMDINQEIEEPTQENKASVEDMLRQLKK